MIETSLLHRKLLLWSSAAAATIVAVSIVGKAVVWWQESRRKKHKSDEIPANWRRVGEIDSLVVYPLKSGHGHETKMAECTEVGLATIEDGAILRLHDRSFIAYNAENGTYKTALQHSKMVLIKVTGGADRQVTFAAPGMTRDLTFKVPDSDKNITKISTNWLREEMRTADCGDEAAAWMSHFVLGKEAGVRLGYHVGDKPNKDVDALPWSDFKQVYTNLRNDDYGLYSDMTSFMLLGKSSVDDLNTRLPAGVSPVTAAHFRPNILVKGSEAYAEDHWDWIKIGNQAVFRNVKPCTRCAFTTISPTTGIRDMEHKEPLKTLKTYRQLTAPAAVKLDGSSPVMGLYVGLHTPGHVKTGDIVYVGVP